MFEQTEIFEAGSGVQVVTTLGGALPNRGDFYKWDGSHLGPQYSKLEVFGQLTISEAILFLRPRSMWGTRCEAPRKVCLEGNKLTMKKAFELIPLCP